MKPASAMTSGWLRIQRARRARLLERGRVGAWRAHDVAVSSAEFARAGESRGAGAVGDDER